MPFRDAKYPPPPQASSPAEPMLPHVVLVAFTVNGADLIDAQRRLMKLLPDPAADCHEAIDCWWIAEDERIDGSDNDSAVFVRKGTAEWARERLSYMEVEP